MADVKWIKIVTDIFDDEKIRFIETMPNGDEMIVIWLRILCLCGKSNNGGLLMMTDKIAYTDEMLASIFNRDIKAIQMALATFEQLDMVEIVNNAIYITNWEKHQSLDKLEAKKLYDREYQRKKREEKKLLLDNSTTIVRQDNDNRVLDIDKEEDIDIKNKNKEINKKTKHKYGDYSNVLLTDEEYEKLNTDYPNADELITYLDEYIEMKGYKAKNHYLAIKKWVSDAVEEKKKKRGYEKKETNRITAFDV